MPVSLAALLPSPCLQCVFVYAELFNSYCFCVCISICVCVHMCVYKEKAQSLKCPLSPSSYLLAQSFIRLTRILCPFTFTATPQICTQTHTHMFSSSFGHLHSYFIAWWLSMSCFSVFYCNMKELLHKHVNGFDHIISWTNRKQQGD